MLRRQRKVFDLHGHVKENNDLMCTQHITQVVVVSFLLFTLMAYHDQSLLMDGSCSKMSLQTCHSRNNVL